jgi:hypothetical protein
LCEEFLEVFAVRFLTKDIIHHLSEFHLSDSDLFEIFLCIIDQTEEYCLVFIVKCLIKLVAFNGLPLSSLHYCLGSEEELDSFAEFVVDPVEVSFTIHCYKLIFHLFSQTTKDLFQTWVCFGFLFLFDWLDFLLGKLVYLIDRLIFLYNI